MNLRPLPPEVSVHPSMRTVFGAVAEFLSEQNGLDRFVSDRFVPQIVPQNLDKKSPAFGGGFFMNGCYTKRYTKRSETN